MDTAHADRLPAAAPPARPARREDLPQIAALLAQLYDAELPGALAGPRDSQARLLQFTLEAKGGQGLRRRYVLADSSGIIHATAALDLPGGPAYERAPDGTVRRALELIGPGATARLLLVVARSMLITGGRWPADAALVHSVVVAAGRRGRGLGAAIMGAVEQEIRAAGLSSAVLQVLQANTPACRLYQRLGYSVFWSSPAYLRALAWPTYLMGKRL